MKKIICLILLITFLNIPSLSFAESGESFVSIEAEDAISDASLDGSFLIEDDETASGNKAMKAKNGFPDSLVQSPSEKPLEFRFNLNNGGRCKIYIRLKGQDSINYSINGSAYQRTWFDFSENDYKWILLTESEFVSGENSFVISARKLPLYIDKVIITNSLLYYPVGMGQSLAEGSGINEIFDKPPVYPEKGKHPRVLLNSERTVKIRKNLKHEENINVYNKVLSALNYKNDGNLNINITDNEDRGALDRIEANAFMYQMTGLEKYADTAVSLMTNYLLTMKYTASSLEDIRNRGGVIFRASLVYDWCYDATCFTKTRKDKMVELILKQAGHLECGWPPVNLSAYDSGHGWENSIIKDLFAFAIAVYDEYPEIYECVAGRVFSEFIPVMNFHYSRGDYFNRAGDDYGLYRYEFELYLSMLLKYMGADDYINENQRNVAYQSIIRLKPDNTRFRIGDIWTYGEKNPPEAYHLMLVASNLFKDPYLKQFFFDRFPEPQNIWNSVTGMSPMLYLILNDTEVERYSRSSLPLVSFSGGDTGVLTVRTSWEQGKDSDAMAVSVHMPERFYGGHQHLDAGSFEVYYKGPLAIDSGVYNSEPWNDENGNPVKDLKYGSEHDLNYHKRTIAHNAMLIYKEDENNFGIGTVNDGGQRVTAWYPHNMTTEEYIDSSLDVSKTVSFAYDETSYTYIRSDLTGWYSQDKLDNYERSFLFYNFSEQKYPGALIVFDKVSAKDADYKKTWLLHSQQIPEISGTRTIIKRNENGYNGRLINETLLPVNPEFNIVGGEGREYFVDGKNFNAVPPYEPTDESGNYRVEVSPSVSEKTDYFLNVIQVSEDDESIIPLNSNLIETNDFYGVKINNRIALFSKENEMFSDEINFSYNSYGKLSYFICGLSKGSWQISTLDETFIKEVTKSGGILTFDAKGGNITVKRINENFTEISTDFIADIKPVEAPSLETYHKYYKSPLTTAVVSKYLLDNGYTLSEYGIMYSKNRNSGIYDEGVIKFPAKSVGSLNGGFGVSITDYKSTLKGNYYLKPYVFYSDNGSNKVAYGKEIFIEGKSSLERIPISWNIVADKAYSIDPTLDVTNPTKDKILTDVAVYPSIVFSSGAGNKYNNSMAFIRFDLSKFSNVNFNKPVWYNIFGAFGTDNENIDSAVVEIYEIDDEIWNELEDENITKGVSAATDIEKVVSGSTPIGKTVVEKAGGYWVSASQAEYYSFDISDCMKKCTEAEKTHLTLAIRLRDISGVSNAITRFRIWQTSTSTSDVTYYKFDE